MKNNDAVSIRSKVATSNLRSNRLTVISAILLAFIIGLVLAAPIFQHITSGDAFSVDLFNRYKGPSLSHPVGTDELGRDLLARLLYGGRVSLFVGIITALITALIGVTIGLSAGFYGGWIDTLLMRTTDSVIALPLLPLLIVLAATDLTKLGLPESLSTNMPSGVSLNISYCLQKRLSVPSLKATLKASDSLPNLNSPKAW